MRGSKFTESQIIGILQQADAGMALPDLCRQVGHQALQLAVLFFQSAQPPSRRCRVQVNKSTETDGAKDGRLFSKRPHAFHDCIAEPFRVLFGHRYTDAAIHAMEMHHLHGNDMHGAGGGGVPGGVEVPVADPVFDDLGQFGEGGLECGTTDLLVIGLDPIRPNPYIEVTDLVEREGEQRVRGLLLLVDPHRQNVRGEGTARGPLQGDDGLVATAAKEHERREDEKMTQDGTLARAALRHSISRRGRVTMRGAIHGTYLVNGLTRSTMESRKRSASSLVTGTRTEREGPPICEMSSAIVCNGPDGEACLAT